MAAAAAPSAADAHAAPLFDKGVEAAGGAVGCQQAGARVVGGGMEAGATLVPIVIPWLLASGSGATSALPSAKEADTPRLPALSVAAAVASPPPPHEFEFAPRDGTPALAGEAKCVR